MLKERENEMARMRMCGGEGVVVKAKMTKGGADVVDGQSNPIQSRDGGGR